MNQINESGYMRVSVGWTRWLAWLRTTKTGNLGIERCGTHNRF